MAFAYLIDPENQFMTKSGTINVDGFLRVFDAATDDPAVTYKDFHGTVNPERIALDNNGRAVVIADSDRVYRLEVYDRYGTLMWTTTPLWCLATGGGVVGGQYEVKSSDGTVDVTRYTDGGVIVFDLSTALTSQAATWGATFATANSVTGDDNWEMLPVVTSAGTSQWSNGWTASKDCVADIAASLEMDGDSSAISTVDVMCVFSVDGAGVSTEYSQLDPSDSRGKVSFEYKGELLEGQVVDCRIFVKSVETMSPALVAKAYFNEECDGIVGGGDDNYTAGDFVEITPAKVINVTGVQPLTGMSAYVEKSAFDDCCSAMSGYVSSLSSQVSSLETSVTAISSTVSGLTGTYVEISSISGYSSIWNSASAVPNKLDESAFTAYTSTAQGFTGVTTDSTLTGNGMSGSALGVNKMELVFDETMNTSISGNSAIVGVNSAIMSGKLDNSASSTWYPMTGNPSGFLTEHQDLSGYVEKSSISAESSQWNDVSSKIPWSALSGDGTKVTGISGSAIGATYSAGEYIDITGDTISVTGLQPVSGMSAYVEQSAFDDCCSAMSGYVSSLQNDVSSISSTVSGLTGTYVEISSISAQSSQWNEISSLSSYVEKSSISAQSSQWNEVSGLSGKLDSSASSNFYTTANESGFASSAYVDSAVSGKQDTLSAGDNISIVGNVISAANQKQSNWTESSNTSVQFILNKPLTKELIAGANITMTEDLTSVTIAAAGTTYSAGTGISISSNTISVDTSVIATQGDLPVFGTITV